MLLLLICLKKVSNINKVMQVSLLTYLTTTRMITWCLHIGPIWLFGVPNSHIKIFLFLGPEGLLLYRPPRCSPIPLSVLFYATSKENTRTSSDTDFPSDAHVSNPRWCACCRLMRKLRSCFLRLGWRSVGTLDKLSCCIVLMHSIDNTFSKTSFS